MEWAQDRAHLKKYKDIQRNIDGSPAAFILKDFEFRTKGNIRIYNSSNKEVSKASITNRKRRFQKIWTMVKQFPISRTIRAKNYVLVELVRGLETEL